MSDYAIYARVSTPDQSLDRQLTNCTEYATTTLNADPGNIDYYRDKSTGTNTKRSGFEDLMDAVKQDDHTHVIVKSVSRLSRSIRDLDATAETIVQENGAELHIISEGFQLQPDNNDPFQNAMFRLLGVFAELEAELAQERTKEGIAARMTSDEEYHHGRSPLGFYSENGKLYPDERHDRICTVLQLVADGEMSKRQAARELDTTRKTIGTCIDERPELYGLDGGDQL